MSFFLSGDDLGALRPKFNAIFIIVGLAMFILIGRLWYLQVIKGNYFYNFSRSNTFKLVNIPASRGRIYDRKNRILADNQPGFQAQVHRQYLTDYEGSLASLAELIDVPVTVVQDSFERGRGQPRFQPIVVGSYLTQDQLARIEVNKIFFPGLDTEAVPLRYYPYALQTFHLLGYIGEISPLEFKAYSREHPGLYKKSDFMGKSGIENLMDPYLKGIDGGEQVAVDALGRRSDDALFIRDLQNVEPIPGNDLHLSIDIDLQSLAHDRFAKKEDAGSAVMMDAKTGALLVLYSAPSLDPTMFARGITKDEWQKIQNNLKKPLNDKSLAGQYPPGSTYKLVTAAAGLELNLIKPQEYVFCPGYFSFGRRNYRCWKDSGHGWMNLHQAIVHSCDVYFYKLGLKIGVDRLAEFAKHLGLGVRTGIGINNEQKGLVPSSEWKLQAKKEPWMEGETLSIAIGQGYDLVTPIQLARALAAFVNGGKVFKPWIVDRIVSPGGEIMKSFSGEVFYDLKFSEANRKEIITAMRDVVQDPGGTAYWARLKDISFGGKTGTAQVVALSDHLGRRLKLEEVSYLQRDHAWFMAFAPVEDPEVVVVVMVEHGGHGSSAAAPIARDLIQKYFELKNPPVPVPSPPAAAVLQKTLGTITTE